MGKIQILRESQLGINPDSNEKIYPVTVTEAIHHPSFGKITNHIHPRILLSEEEMDLLIENNGPFLEGYDYIVCEEI